MTEAGDLRERVRFERRITTGDDGYGNVRQDWMLMTRVAARIAPMRGSEEVLANRLQGIQSYEITVRASKVTLGLLPSDRAIDERHGTVFNITAVDNPDEKRQWLRLTAQE